MKRLAILCAVAVLASASLGCGQKRPAGMPPLEPVQITITQGSTPLSNAVLSLKALDASSGNFTCGGTTDEKGVATIVTHGQYKGAPVGKYKVSVTCTVGEGTPPPPSPIDEESARVWQEYQDSGATYEEFYVVDPKFAIFETTTLEVEVVAGKNAFTLDCGEPVRLPVDVGHGASGGMF